MGREAELASLRRALKVTRGVTIVGPFGSGKTALARKCVAEAETTRAFPGGIFLANTSVTDRPRRVLARVAPEVREPALLVLDDAALLDDEGLRELQLALDERPQLKWLLTSTHPLPLRGSEVELLPLSTAEAVRLRGERLGVAPTAMDSDLLNSLYASTGGNPRGILGVGGLVRSGAVSSAAALQRYLNEFHASGILGLGRIGAGDSEAAERRIVVDTSFVNAELLQLLRREPALLRRLTPRKFEEIVADLLEKQGYSVQLTPASRDGGFDMYAAKKDGLGML